jgi:UDP-N-acetylglucosamine transferase subunit ALG13
MMISWSFDRLLIEMDRIAGSGEISDDFLIQTGCSRYKVRNARSVDFLDGAQIEEEMKNCRIVISHAGVGTIMDARRMGKPIIIVPRDPKFRESFDDHQRRTAQSLEGVEGIFVAWKESDLVKLIGEALSYKSRVVQSEEKDRLVCYLRHLIEDAESRRDEKTWNPQLSDLRS